MGQLSRFQSLLHCAALSPRWIMTDSTVRRTLATRLGWRNIRPFWFDSATAIPRYCFWGAGARGGMQNVKTQITSNSEREIFTIFDFAKIVNLTLEFYFSRNDCERMFKKLSLRFRINCENNLKSMIWREMFIVLINGSWLKWCIVNVSETLTLYKW